MFPSLKSRMGATSWHVEMAEKKCLLLLYVGQCPCLSSVKPRKMSTSGEFWLLVRN
jgi:hypothetical protein